MKTRLTDILLLTIAKLAVIFFEKFCKEIDYALLRKHFRNDMYKFKYKRLHDEAFNYYYDFMITDPAYLAYELASKDMKALEKKHRVEKLYEKKFIKK